MYIFLKVLYYLRKNQAASQISTSQIRKENIHTEPSSTSKRDNIFFFCSCLRQKDDKRYLLIEAF